MVAPVVVILKSYDAASDRNFVKMTTFKFSENNNIQFSAANLALAGFPLITRIFVASTISIFHHTLL